MTAGLEETKSQIRFALFNLKASNGHHVFETLCRALARLTVSRNILPATGPVSAGGDQGRDFETYTTLLPGQVEEIGRRLGISSNDEVAFTCTLQSGLPRVWLTGSAPALVDS
jgi:hypothetical protein